MSMLIYPHSETNGEMYYNFNMISSFLINPLLLAVHVYPPSLIIFRKFIPLKRTAMYNYRYLICSIEIRQYECFNFLLCKVMQLLPLECYYFVIKNQHIYSFQLPFLFVITFQPYSLKTKITINAKFSGLGIFCSNHHLFVFI